MRKFIDVGWPGRGIHFGRNDYWGMPRINFPRLAFWLPVNIIAALLAGTDFMTGFGEAASCSANCDAPISVVDIYCFNSLI